MGRPNYFHLYQVSLCSAGTDRVSSPATAGMWIQNSRAWQLEATQPSGMSKCQQAYSMDSAKVRNWTSVLPIAGTEENPMEWQPTSESRPLRARITVHARDDSRLLASKQPLILNPPFNALWWWWWGVKGHLLSLGRIKGVIQSPKLWERVWSHFKKSQRP